MGRQDTQYTEDELALMRGEELPASAPEADQPPQAAASEEDEQAEAPAGDEPQATPAADAPPADPEAAEQPAAFVPQFDGSLPEDFEAQKQALRAEKAELRTKWASGELTDEEFNTAEAAWDDKYEALQSQFLTAQALAAANAQIQRQQAQSVLKDIAANAAKQGIDYSDNAVALVYDTKLTQVRAEPEFAGKSFAEVAAEAHARVAKLFGKATTAPNNTPADGAKPDLRSKLPQTLANMPAAAAPNLGSDPIEDDLGDDPDLAEAKWAQMPVSKRNTVLRATLPASRRR